MLAAVYASLLLWLVCKSPLFRIAGFSNKTVAFLFVLKIAAGLSLWLVYTVYYPDRSTGDTWKYFDDALTIKNWWRENRNMFWRFLFGWDLSSADAAPFFEKLHGWTNPYTYGLANDAPTMVRINVVLSFLSFGYYEVHVVFMAFFSFVGLILLYRAWSTFLSNGRRLFFVALFLSPSLLFWSSGVLKEAPLILALGALWWSYMAWLSGDGSKGKALVFMVALITMFSLKEYVLLCSFPALVFLAFNKWYKRRPLVVFLMVHAAFAWFATHPFGWYKAGDLVYVLGKKRADFYQVSQAAQAGSTIELPELTSSLDLLVNFPSAFSVTYFRPYLFECSSPLMWISALENSVYLLGFLILIFTFRKQKVDRPIFLAAASIVVCSAVIIGNSVPVLGAVVRYKIAALPFFIYLVIAHLPPRPSWWREKLKGISESI